MIFELTEMQKNIVQAAKKISSKFDDNYWLDLDLKSEFPSEFYNEVAKSGWLGMCMPEEYGGANLGIQEAALFMQNIARNGGGMSAASSIHINIFGPHPIVVHGTQTQKKGWLPNLISGSDKTCFGVTEPDAGLDTGKIKTTASKIQGGYLINGQKIWTSTAKIANKILLLARTSDLGETKNNIDGLTLFYTDFDRTKIEVREIKKMGRDSVDSNQIFFDNLEISEEDRIGEEGKGFRYILDSLNPERILIAAEALGIGKDALDKAVKYANERIVFDRPIGKNQSIQHPLAELWIELEAAELLISKAAYQYDKGQNSGGLANAAKYYAAEVAFKTATQAVVTLGGMGYAKEYHVERLLRESLIPKLAPVSSQMILNYISEKILHLPRSY
ncbi:acyl-CoA/acyl-ACP dehydrogenase [Alphaproteobacteria bacterium]|nr:acyl-CoA/acyl-ACP dehydrogenase [Alphaproteobacteria bacterium]